MDRRLVLRMLFEKSDQAKQFLKKKFRDDINVSNQLILNYKKNSLQESSPQQPHIVFKRMQLLQMGKCKINAPQQTIDEQNAVNKHKKRETNYSLQDQNKKAKIFSVSIHKKASKQISQQRNSEVEKFCQNNKTNFLNERQRERPQSSNSNFTRRVSIKQNIKESSNKITACWQQYDLSHRKSYLLSQTKQRQVQAINPHQNQSNYALTTNCDFQQSQRSNIQKSFNQINIFDQSKVNHTQTSISSKKQDEVRCQSRKQPNLNTNTNCNSEWENKVKYNDNRSLSSFNKRTVLLFNQAPKSSFNTQKDIFTKQSQQKKNKMVARKQIHRNYAKAFVQPPKISSQSYIISQIGRNDRFKIHYAYQSKNMVEIASLTKIMTCLVAIQFSEKYEIKMEQQKVYIGKFQSNIGGTSAQIQKGQIYTLQQLLYGLMLPSGNDASLAIAVCIGRKLLIRDMAQKNKQKVKKQDDLTFFRQYQLQIAGILKKQCFQRFVLEMNSKAKSLGMNKTNYANSHGLINNLNKSCAYDLSVLCEYAISNKKFAQIVNTKSYTTKIQYLSTSTQQETEIQNDALLNDRNRYIRKRLIKKTYKDSHLDDSYQNSQQDDMEAMDADQDRSQTQQTNFTVPKSQTNLQTYTNIPNSDIKTKDICWQNTHRLLHQKSSQYFGIKTGVTKMAGPCLASCVKSPEGREFIIIVLNCKKMALRFKETEILKKWIYKKQGILVKKSQKMQITQDKQQKWEAQAKNKSTQEQ